MSPTNRTISWLLPLALAAPLSAQTLELATVLRPDLPEDTATFGRSLDIRGPILAATAVGPTPLTERAYVYVSTPEGWKEETVLAPDVEEGQGIQRVALDDDCLIGGAYLNDEAGDNAGAAFIFRRSSTGWIEEAKLTAPNAEPDDFFGWSVAIDGDWAVVGAAADRGFAWVYRHVAGQWFPFERLRSPSAGNHFFGASVDLSRTDVIVGAPVFSCEAFVFGRSMNGFELESNLWALSVGQCDGFDASWGDDVSIQGDRIVLTDNDDYAPRAELFVYDRQDGVWTPTTDLLVSFCGYVRAVDQAGERILTADSGERELMLFSRDPVWKLADSEPPPPRFTSGSFGSDVALTKRWAAVNTTAAGGNVLVYRVVD